MRVIAWVLLFANNARKGSERKSSSILSLPEIEKAKELWCRTAQETTIQREIQTLNEGKKLSPRSRILPFHPFVDKHKLLRVGGRLERAKISFSECHLVLLPGEHRVTRLLTAAEHIGLLHAGPTLVSASLSCVGFELQR